MLCSNKLIFITLIYFYIDLNKRIQDFAITHILETLMYVG